MNQVTRSGQKDFQFTREEEKRLDVLCCNCTSLWRKDSRHSGAQGVSALVFLWDCLKIHSVSHGILGTRGRLRTLNDMSVSWLFQMVFFSQREGCCRRVEGDRFMRLHKFMEEGFTRLRVTHKIRWWQAASIRKKGFRAVLDLQSQGVCDYMHWSLGFSEGFHGVLGLNLHGISVSGGVLIYVGISALWYSLVSVKGVAEGLKEIDSCGYVFGVTHSFLLEWICENEELLIQGRVQLNGWRCQIEIDSGWKHVCFGFYAWDSVVVCFGFSGHMRGKQMGLQGITVAEQVELSGGICWQHQRFRVMFKARIESKGFWFEAVVIQVLQELQVSIDINWKFWRRRINRFVVTITTTTTSKTEEETFTEDDLKARDGFSEGFYGVLGLNLHGISVAGGVLIYVDISARWYSLVSVKGVAEGLKEIDSCGYVFGVTHSFLLEWICENEELLVQGRVRLNGWRCQIEIDSGRKHVCFGFSAWDSVVVCFGFSGHMRGKQMGLQGITVERIESKGFWFEAVVIQVLQELQVSIDISWKFWRRKISRFVVTITTTTTSETEEETFTEDDLKARDVFRDLRFFQRSQGMQVILAKDDQRILQLYSSFSEVLRARQKVSGCKKKTRIVTKSLKEISSELTIRGRYEEEAIVRRTSSDVDRCKREASTIEDYDRSMYILYHRSMSRREMRDLVPADFKPKASPNYKITPNEFLT
ncbi:hypothetical protein F2Q68_00012220 [Brassica cretica]|uniref:Uncharacterized protein n=1 Tax=Brassica cretica TaxID=69181 RepID=A0A8S9KRB4_BRACR|nr:hypothetical protein F2Q68_00012220 [Brassica cretica]